MFAKGLPRLTTISRVASLAFYSQVSGGSTLGVRVTPALPHAGKIIIPISMGRYDPPASLKEETRQRAIVRYDEEIKTLLEYTADYSSGRDGREVVVLSTAGLQKINWGEEKANAIGAHFLSQHPDLLKRQSHHYTWEQFIRLDEAKFAESYDRVLKESGEGTEWYQHMLQTHKRVRMSDNLEKSLEYQRKEYATTLLISHLGFSHLLYTGPISAGSAYMHKNLDLKFTFIQATITKVKKDEKIDHTAGVAVKFTLDSMRTLLTDSRVPPKDKAELEEHAQNLLYVYGNLHKQKKLNDESPDKFPDDQDPEYRR